MANKTKGALDRHSRLEAERLDRQVKGSPTIEIAFSLVRKGNAYLSEAGQAFFDAQSILRRIQESAKQPGPPQPRQAGRTSAGRKVLVRSQSGGPSVDRCKQKRGKKTRISRASRNVEQFRSRYQEDQSQPWEIRS